MILRRSTLLSQPQGPAEVDWHNPVTRGLIAASNGRDGTHGLNLSAIPKGLSKSGTVLVAPGASGYRVPLRSSVTSSEWTLFSRVSIAGTEYQAIFGLYGSSSEFISQMPRIFPSYALGTDARPYAVDSSSGSFLSVGAESTITTVISASSNVIEHYINGALVSSASLSSTSQITVNSIEVFTKNLTQDRAEAGSTIGTFAAFNRALTAKEVGALSANPWQLFRPAQRRIYFDMVAGGGAAHIVTADPVEQGSTTTRPVLTQTHITTASAVAQGATVSRPAITQTHIVTARAVAQGSTVNAPAVEEGSITVVTARPVVQSSTVKAPSIVQTHIVTARPALQGGTVTRPGLNQAHTVTARAVTQSSVVNAPSVDVGSTPATFVTARPVAQGSTVNAPGIRQAHVTSARAVVQGSTINAPGLVQTHVVTARPVVQSSTVRVAGVAPPFVRSMYLAAVPAGEYSATVPAGNYRASI